MWWFLANLDFWQWLWVVVLCLLVVVGWLWAVVLGRPCWWISLWCFYCSEIDYFIVVDILFYCDFILFYCVES